MRLLPLAARAARGAWGVRGGLGVVLFGWLAARGSFGAGGPWPIVAAAALAALAGERIVARLRLRRIAPRIEAESALLLVVAAYAAVGLAGGAGGPLHPIVYACAIFLAASERLPVAAAGLALAAAFEWHLAPGDSFAWHAGLLLFFAGGGAALFRAEIMRQRREHRRRVEDEVLALREDARDFRLIGAALGPQSRVRSRAEEEQKLAQGSVETIRQGHYYLMDLVKRSLDLRTCALLWLDEEGARLKIKEIVSDSDEIAEAPFGATVGAPGAVVRGRIAVSVVRPGDLVFPYYRSPQRVGAFLGVPVLEDGHVRGVLCVDRRDERAFDGRDEHLLRGTAQQLLRIVQTERLLGAVERSKYETERFLEASNKLASALTLDQVYDKALEAARAITSFDFAGFTLIEAERRRHRVCRVYFPDGGDMARIEGLEYADNAGLVAMAVKNKHALEGDGDDRIVFTSRVRLPGMKSLLVVPLVVKDEAVGALVLGSRRPSHFSRETAGRLGVIANQVAVSVENAKMYRRMEEMATTDGLTRLANHRTMQERLGAMIERSARFGSPLAFLLCDIDHFKSINDTYGHPMGDVVLRRVGQLISESVRKIDLCARYGGEEFALAMEQTDLEGARQFGERIRQDLGAIPFATERGTFHVTLSIGVALCPQDAARKDMLVERADQALYRAKHGGRNRVVAWSDSSASSSRAAAAG